MTAGALTLGNGNSIADTATLSFAETVSPATFINLDNASTEALATITSTTDAITFITPGAYTAAALNGFLSTTVFSGTGTLTLGVPEPASLAVAAVGAAGLLTRRRRHAA